MTRRAAFLLAVGAVGLRAADPVPVSLEAVLGEPDLEKRSRAAVEFALSRIETVLAHYVEGKPDEARAELEQMVTAAETCVEALMQTGKNPRKKAKPFKRAEIGTRRLITDLERLRKDLTFEERPDLDPIIARLEAINKDLLDAIMQKKR